MYPYTAIVLQVEALEPANSFCVNIGLPLALILPSFENSLIAFSLFSISSLIFAKVFFKNQYNKRGIEDSV